MNLLGKRLKEIRGSVPVKVFAKILGVSPAYIYDIEAGKKTRISDTLGALISTKFNVSLDWILTGTGEANKQVSEIREERALYNNVKLMTDKLVELEVFAFAGAGGAVELCEPHAIEKLVVPSRWAGPSVMAIKIRGDSMSPTFMDGAIVGIDKTDTHIVSGKAYAVWFAYEGAVIKRLFIEPGRVILRADNAHFPESHLAIQDLTEGFVLGRVVWVVQNI